MGGHYSHEYQLLTDAGQDDVMSCSSCGSSFNQELLNTTTIGDEGFCRSDEEMNNQGCDGQQSSGAVIEEQTTAMKKSESKVNEGISKNEKRGMELKCLNCGRSDSIQSRKGIEVGHTFLLGTRYSKPFNACFNVQPSMMNSSSSPPSSPPSLTRSSGSLSAPSLSPSSPLSKDKKEQKEENETSIGTTSSSSKKE